MIAYLEFIRLQMYACVYTQKKYIILRVSTIEHVLTLSFCCCIMYLPRTEYIFTGQLAIVIFNVTLHPFLQVQNILALLVL